MFKHLDIFQSARGLQIGNQHNMPLG